MKKYLLVFLLVISSSVLSFSQMRAMDVIQDWPDTAKKAAQFAIEKYGEPIGVTSDRLIWKDKAPWREIVVYRNEIQHNFPMPHEDVLEQEIPYQVPLDRLDELGMYDGSVIVDITKGTMSARCDAEPANILALNLAHDVITGRRTVEQAREL